MKRITRYLFIPVDKNGSRLLNEFGEFRMYANQEQAYKSLKNVEFDKIRIYAEDDIVLAEEFMKLCSAWFD